MMRDGGEEKKEKQERLFQNFLRHTQTYKMRMNSKDKSLTKI